MKAPIAILTTLLLGAGCGSSGSGPGGGGDPSGCTGVLSGSVSGTITGCTMSWVMMNDGSAMVGNDDHIDSTGDESGAYYALGLTFLTAGEPRMTTLDDGSSESASASVRLNNGGAYAAQHDKRHPEAPMFGSASITITGFSQPDASVRRWLLHGTARAAMVTPPGVTAYSGAASLQLSF